jgi:hypothetical protein
VTDSRAVQLQKHDLHRIVTDDGITIDSNPVIENADSPIRSNREMPSKRTDFRAIRPEKHEFDKTTTDDGITTDFNGFGSDLDHGLMNLLGLFNWKEICASIFSNSSPLSKSSDETAGNSDQPSRYGGKDGV